MRASKNRLEMQAGQGLADITAPDGVNRACGCSLSLLPLQAKIALLREFQVGLDEQVELLRLRRVEVEMGVPQHGGWCCPQVLHDKLLKKISSAVHSAIHFAQDAFFSYLHHAFLPQIIQLPFGGRLASHGLLNTQGASFGREEVGLAT